MRCFENSTFAFVSISNESLLTGAVERSRGICACSIVSATIVRISSAFINVENEMNRTYHDHDIE